MPSQIGRHYWCVKTGDLSQSGEIFTFADAVEVTPSGDLLFTGHLATEESVPVLVIAKGEWRAFYMLSDDRSSPISVERWRGVVNRS
jgi:hypothetical protein